MAVRRCNQKLPGGGTCNRVLPEPGAGGGRPRTKCEICSPPRTPRAGTERTPEAPPPTQVILLGTKDGSGEPLEGSLAPESVYMATLSQLTAAGRQSTAAGAAALVLASQLDANVATAPSVSNALLKALDVALAGAKLSADRLDDLQKRRERKAASA